jgi:hypothetical protein
MVSLLVVMGAAQMNSEAMRQTKRISSPLACKKSFIAASYRYSGVGLPS